MSEQPFRVYGFVWKGSSEETCAYDCSYTPDGPLKDGELFALVEPTDLPSFYTQWEGQDESRKHPVVYNYTTKERELLKALLADWDSVCISHGWDKDHLIGAKNARALLNTEES